MPYNHLQGKGCHYCSRNQKITIDEFIKKANKKHNYKYYYPDKNYINNVTPINIECIEHGLFKQAPGTHLKGIGCSKCSGNRRLTNDEFIKKANKRHNNLYTYPNLDYKNYDSKVNVKCKKHDIFNQTVRDHLSGRGCPICRNSKGELKILEILNSNNIKYDSQYTFNNLKHKGFLKFDFVIFNSNGGIKYLIEYNGQQHYQFKKMFHRDYNNFIINQHRDKLKIDYCNNNKLNLYIIKYDEDINDEMLKILKNN